VVGVAPLGGGARVATAKVARVCSLVAGTLWAHDESEGWEARGTTVRVRRESVGRRAQRVVWVRGDGRHAASRVCPLWC